MKILLRDSIAISKPIQAGRRHSTIPLNWRMCNICFLVEISCAIVDALFTFPIGILPLFPTQ